MDLNSLGKLSQLSSTEAKGKIARYKKYVKYLLVFCVIYSLVPLCLKSFAPNDMKNMFIYWFACRLHYFAGMMISGTLAHGSLLIMHYNETIDKDTLSELKRFRWAMLALFIIFMLLVEFC